jgi:DinB superfamily
METNKRVDMSTPSSRPQLSPQLAAIASELADVSTAWKTFFNDLSKEKLWQRPSKGGWSVGECVDHLTTTTRQMVPRLESILPNAPKGSEPYKMDLKGRLLVWFMEPPYRMKFKAVPSFQPHASDKDVLAEFLASQDVALDAIGRCNGFDLNHMKFVSPVDERLTYNAYAALKLLPAHQRRHLWQAQQVLKLL